MLKTPQCPGLVSGWLLTFLWPIAMVVAMLALRGLYSNPSDFTDGVTWALAILVGGATVGIPLYRAMTSLQLWLARLFHSHNPYGCPCCGHDIVMTPHRCPECGAKLLWGELPETRP